MALFRFFAVVISLVINFSDSVYGLPQITTRSDDGDLPFLLSHFTSTVASVQNTYCGAAKNHPGLKFGDQTLLYTFGDGDTVQRTNIYHSESLGIIVAYMGTNITSLISIAQDVELLHALPAPALGLPLGSTVFTGFQLAWFNGWMDVKHGVSEVLKKYPNERIIVTGHSQGAAIALLGALSIRHTFGDVIKEVIAYGPPRIGNLVFANAFDEIFEGKYTGVINGADWVPTVPPQFLGYRHPSNMVWINPANSTSWKYYTGQENQEISARSSEIFYPGTLQFYWGDHQGIYMHSSMGTQIGPCPAEVGGY